MNIQIKTTNISLTDSISQYVDKKVSSLEKFLEADTIVHVELSKLSDHHKHGDIFRAEIRAYVRGKDVYVQKETSDLFAAIDAVKDEANRVLSVSKEKAVSFARRGGAKVKAMIKGIFNK